MKTSVIPVFIPHIGCPYRCIFCNQWKITGEHGLPTREEILEKIESYRASAKEERYWELAFYGGSFTALPEEWQISFLEIGKKALEEKKIHEVRLSTRPDFMDDTIVARLKEYGVTIVELGVQSMDDSVLKKAKRGHTAEDVRLAVERLRNNSFTIGLQFMPGLPGENRESFEQTVREIGALRPDFVRIYPVVVIEDTELATAYKKQDYVPLTVAKAVPLAGWAKECLHKLGIPSIRTGLQATEELDEGTSVLGGAYHPAFGELTDSWIYRRRLQQAIDQWCPLSGPVEITYARADTSKVRGMRNGTVKRFALRYHKHCHWTVDDSLPKGVVGLEKDGKKIFVEMV